MDREPELIPAHLERATIRRSLPCARCGYDVRGLPVDGHCPECGFSVWISVQVVIDPRARRLPTLTDPRGVGDALLWIVFVVCFATVLVVARPVALRLDALKAPAVAVFSSWTPPALMLVAGLVALSGIWSVIKLAPPRGKEPRVAVWGDIWLMLVGLLAGGGMLLIVWRGEIVTPGAGTTVATERAILQASVRLTLVASIAIVMLGLRGVLRLIGLRSREYRTAQGGRQGTRELILAAIGVGAGEVTSLVGLSWNHAGASAIGGALVWISALMLVVGLAYLVVNAWWIRRSLRTPPPTLAEVLNDPPALTESGAGDSEPVETRESQAPEDAG